MHDNADYTGQLQKGADLAAQLIKYTNSSFFITGKPGAGKKTFLKKITADSGKKFIWLSPDSLSAFTTGGTSVHSFFHLPFSPFIWQTADPAQKNIFFNFHAEKRKIIEQVELIIIDDVQLLRADIIDAIDFRLRRFGGKRNQPFGGRQVVFTGDVFQLPEVASDLEWQALSKYYNTPYFFSARSLLKTTLPVIEFTQQPAVFGESLAAFMELVRSKQLQLPDVQELNQLYATGYSTEETSGFITLTTDTAAADAINLQMLSALPATPYSYAGVFEGRFVRERNNSLLPANQLLELKENTQVIFVKDDEDGKWKRGTTGRITGLTENNIRVKILQNGVPVVVNVAKVTWHNIRYEGGAEADAIHAVSTGSFSQFPLRLGWAISVPDSRGLQFEKVLIDLGEISSGPGLTFQALCRCKTLRNLKLKTIISEEDLLVRDEVVRMIKTANNEALITSNVAAGKAQNHIKNFVKQFDNGDFIAAIESFSNATGVKNDYRIAAFKRLLVYKFSRLRRGFSQKMPQEMEIAAPVQPPIVVQQSAVLEDKINALEKIAEQSSFSVERLTRLEKLVQVLTEQEHSGNGTAAKQQDLDLKFIVLSNELEALQRQLIESGDAFNSVNETLEKCELKNRGASHANQILNEKLNYLETDYSRIKKIALAGGIILFVLAAAALLLAIF